jgi:hypothetical protein
MATSLVLLAAAVPALAIALPAWLSALVVAGGCAIVLGFVVLRVGNARFRAANLKVHPFRPITDQGQRRVDAEEQVSTLASDSGTESSSPSPRVRQIELDI